MTMPTLSKGYSIRGANLGRRSFKTDNDDQRFFLQKLIIDAGGYDPGGAYWGSSSTSNIYRYVCGIFPIQQCS